MHKPGVDPARLKRPAFLASIFSRGGIAALLVGRPDPVKIISAGDLAGRAKLPHLSFIQPQAALAKRLDGPDIMAGEQQRRSTIQHRAHAPHALCLEPGIANRQGFVDDQDIRSDMRGNREGKTDIHAAGVGLYRLIDIGSDIGKSHDVVQPLGDLLFGETHNRGVDHRILAPGKLGIEPCPQFEQCGDSPVDAKIAASRLHGPGQHLQQGGLAGAVGADDAQRFAARQLETDALQGDKFASKLASTAPQCLGKAVMGLVVDTIGLAQVIGLNRPFAGGQKQLR